MRFRGRVASDLLTSEKCVQKSPCSIATYRQGEIALSVETVALVLNENVEFASNFRIADCQCPWLYRGTIL